MSNRKLAKTVTLRRRSAAVLAAGTAVLVTSAWAQAGVEYFAYTPTRNSWTGNNWATSSGGSYTTAWGGYSEAVLEGTGGTVSSTNAPVNKITFNADGYVLTGSFTMGSPAASNFIVNGIYTGKITANLGYANGSNVLWKTGTGTLELSGTNSAPKMIAQGGTLKVTGGSTTDSGDFYIGGPTYEAVDPTVGTFVITGGSVTVGGSGKNFQMGQNRNGSNKVAQFTQTGGTFTINNGTFVGIGNGGGVSQLDLSGGNFNANGNTVYLGVRGNATLNISGTANVNLGGLLQMGWATSLDLNPTQNTVNLGNGSAGGTLTAPRIATGATGSSVFHFNGGTLKAAADQASFMSGLTTADVQSGGAILDTNSHNITIAQALTAGSPSGGLTKIGAGTLTLTGANTYTGNTEIDAGTLSINSADLADDADVLLTTGATFDLNFTGTDTIAGLYFDNVLQAGGTWGSLTSSAIHKSSFFTGDGVLYIASVPAPQALSAGLTLLSMVLYAPLRRRRAMPRRA